MASRIWIISTVVLLVLLILLSGGYSQLQASYQSESSRLSANIAYNSNLTGENAYLQSELNASRSAYEVLLGNYTQKSYVFEPPSGANQTFQIWGIQETMGPHSIEAWDLLDTFVNHIEIKTTLPANFYIFDMTSFIEFAQGKYSSAIINETGVTTFSDNFTLSVGCALYVLVIQNIQNMSNIVIPHVTATYAPSNFLTGVCAS